MNYAGNSTSIRPKDFITHADGRHIISETLQSFLESGMKEAVIPVIDDEDSRLGGHRLLGFIVLQPALNSQTTLGTRRGDIEFNMKENVISSSNEIGIFDVFVGLFKFLSFKCSFDSDYPPNGGGACITNKDWYCYLLIKLIK